jgi:hypothetical protein
MLRVTLPLAFLLTALLGAFGQTCDLLRTLQQRTYGFHPAQLTHEQQDIRGNQIDDFWTAVKQAGPDGIICLKSMLVSQKSDGYFQFDGASLLYSLDHSPEAVQAAADAVGRSELADVDPIGYIGLAQLLARSGADISAAARNYLHEPRVVAELPGQLNVDRSTGAIFLFGSMTSAAIDRVAIPELNATQPYARHTAALVLALNMTEAGLKALRHWPGRAVLPEQEAEEIRKVLRYQPVTAGAGKLTREQVLERLRKLPDAPALSLAENQDWEASAIATLTAGDLEEIREARRRSMSLTAAAIYDYFALTKIMLGVINRLDLFRDARIHPAANAAPAGTASKKK